MTIRILTGDCLETLRTLPAESVNCCVTSPPYWGLRDYGVAGQLGLEATPEEYVAKMVAVFREVRRVLRADGTLWLNLGDSFYSSPSGQNGTTGSLDGGVPCGGAGTTTGRIVRPPHPTLKPKDLVGIPWRVAFALQADGWWLRSDIIWHKPNPMPESVTDRPTKAHEYVFLMAKSETYEYDADAIAERALGSPREKAWGAATYSENGRHSRIGGGPEPSSCGVSDTGDRNARSVWSIGSEPFAEAHFATMPTRLVERCVKAGSAEGGHVLDPFGGAGTTGLVAQRLGRSATLIELNPTYAAMARKRIDDDAPLFMERP